MHVTPVEVRSYELDSFGHVNHAVYLNYFEHARFEALSSGGFSPEVMADRGEGVHVVRVAVDYRSEVFMGDRLEVVTRVGSARNSSMTLHQVARREGEPEAVCAEAEVVVVWVGADRRPMRIPDDVRLALGMS